MARVKLKKLFSQKNSLVPALTALFDVMNPRLAIQDIDGSWLYGTPNSHVQKVAIEMGSETLGWVAGENARHIAALIAAIAAKEAEKIALADEVLEKYRELNLLYNLSDKLATTLDLSAVAKITLTESSRLIRSPAGKIILCENVQSVATFGDQLLATTFELMERTAARTSDTGKGEIVNAEDGTAASLLSVPLKAQDRVIGVIVLAREPTQTFTAEEFKLLATVASEAAPVIENAIQMGGPFSGNVEGTTGYYDPVNNVTVITDTASGRVVTVY